jgi:hypothetical protein
MFDDVRGVPIIIDFGLSYDSKHLDIPTYIKEDTKPFGITVPFYIPWTIETILLSYLANELKGKGSHIQEEKLQMPFDKIAMFKELCSEYVKKNGLLQSKKLFKEEEKETYKKMLYSWVESWKGKTWRNVWVILSNSHKTWDNYSLCALYLIEMQISGLLQISDIHKDEHNSFLKKYVLVLKKEMLAKPNERSLPGTTRKELHSIFSQANKMEYKNTIQKFKILLSENREKMKKERISYNMNTLQEEKGIYKKFNN